MLLPFYSEKFFHFLFCFQTHQVQMFYWLTAQPRKENSYMKPLKWEAFHNNGGQKFNHIKFRVLLCWVNESQ